MKPGYKEQECKKCGRVFGSVKCFDVDCPNNMPKITINQENKDLLLQIPNKIDDTVRLYVDGVFVDRLNVTQVCQYRNNILKYIYETEDSSILDRFYFICHQDTDDKPCEEIKIQMDIYGNFSDSPYEMNYVRRYTLETIRLARNNIETITKIQNK